MFMKLTDDFEIQTKRTLPVVYMTLGVSLFVVALLVFILYLNKDQFTSNSGYVAQGQTESEEAVGNSLNDLIGNPNVSAGDLNIWYRDDFTSDEPTTSTSKPKYEAAFEQLEEEEQKRLEEEQKRLEEELKAQDPSEGGTKTMIVTADGEQWVKINPYLDKNTYEEDGFSTRSSIRTYSEDGEVFSFFGINISEKTGEIKFDTLQKAGVDFVMIQLGSRGYQTGIITVDSMFQEYMQGATEAGIEVGICFDSQAITEDEIREEVAFIRAQIGEYEVSYPVVLRMEEIKRDDARTDDLEVLSRTDLVNVFAAEIGNVGYIPMLYGTKEFLIQSIELSQLINIDIWLFQESDIPDYPYAFQMWKYTTEERISGITGTINDFNISFIDYTKK